MASDEERGWLMDAANELTRWFEEVGLGGAMGQAGRAALGFPMQASMPGVMERVSPNQPSQREAEVARAKASKSASDAESATIKAFLTALERSSSPDAVSIVARGNDVVTNEPSALASKKGSFSKSSAGTADTAKARMLSRSPADMLARLEAEGKEVDLKRKTDPEAMAIDRLMQVLLAGVKEGTVGAGAAGQAAIGVSGLPGDKEEAFLKLISQIFSQGQE